MCGTPNYMAPEVFDLKTDGYDFRCDMWSVGVVVFCLLGGYLPFEGTLQELHVLVTKEEYYFHEEYWKHITPSAKQMISSMLQLSPVVRYSAEQALACKWMGMDDEELSVMDLSDTQNKMRSMTSGKEKLKHVVRAVSIYSGLVLILFVLGVADDSRPVLFSAHRREQIRIGCRPDERTPERTRK
jgi:serine/threonine protein kinase